MKTDSFKANMLFFCYAFFSFAVFQQNGKYTFFTWCWILGIYMIFCLFSIFLTVNNKKLKPLSSLLILIYIIYLLGLQSYKMWEYMKLYHGQTSAMSTLIITALTVLVLARIKDIDIANLYLPLFALVILLMTVVIAINFSKISVYNIATSDRTISLKYNITLFDFLVPYLVVLNSAERKNKLVGISFTIFTVFCLLCIVLLAFMSVKGNLLYSVSPLQMLFQLSSSSLIRNFDALFNYLLYFSYFGAVTSLMYAYKTIKNDFEYFRQWDLLLIIPFFLLHSIITELVFAILELTIVAIIFVGRYKKGYYEKTSD